MAFDNEPVGTGGDGSHCERQNKVNASCGMAGINNDGQMAFVFCDGDRPYVEGAPCRRFECPYTSFAEDHIRASVDNQVFRR